MYSSSVASDSRLAALAGAVPLHGYGQSPSLDRLP